MSGHSKWKKIKHKKEASDSKKGKVYTTLIKEITIAARQGGGDPGFNPRLRSAIMAARQANMPNDNVDRAIKKGTGELEGVSYEEVSYEGYGPAGTALIVEVITDNKNRTVGEIRSMFSKHGGNLGTSGSVGWMFSNKGLISIDKKTVTEEKLMEVALEAGADDIKDEGDVWDVYMNPDHFEAVKGALEKNNIKFLSADVGMIPNATIHLSGKPAEQMMTLIEELEEHDDVKKVYSNFDIDEKELEKMAS